MPVLTVGGGDGGLPRPRTADGERRLVCCSPTVKRGLGLLRAIIHTPPPPTLLVSAVPVPPPQIPKFNLPPLRAIMMRRRAENAALRHRP